MGPGLQLVGARFLGHRLGDDLVDWNSGVSVRTSTKVFSDFHVILCVVKTLTTYAHQFDLDPI